MLGNNVLAKVNAAREETLRTLQAQRRRIHCACVHSYEQNNGSKLLACELPDPGCRTCGGSGVVNA